MTEDRASKVKLLKALKESPSRGVSDEIRIIKLEADLRKSKKK